MKHQPENKGSSTQEDGCRCADSILQWHHWPSAMMKPEHQCTPIVPCFPWCWMLADTQMSQTPCFRQDVWARAPFHVPMTMLFLSLTAAYIPQTSLHEPRSDHSPQRKSNASPHATWTSHSALKVPPQRGICIITRDAS